MKALSVKQPYAALIATGHKTIETRTWSTKYRGELLICSGNKIHTAYNNYDPSTQTLFIHGMPVEKSHFSPVSMEHLLLGHGLCVVDLVDCRPMAEADQDDACCMIYPGAFSWVLENPRPIKPLTIKGQLGLFDVDDPIIHFK